MMNYVLNDGTEAVARSKNLAKKRRIRCELLSELVSTKSILAVF